MAESNKQLVVLMTKGADHELSSVGFTIANGGITSGFKVLSSSPARPWIWFASVRPIF
jgi:hypothetical protein